MDQRPEETSKNYHRKGVACKQWTAQQLTLLLDAQKACGNNWKKISVLYFPDRNANQLKCKFSYITRRYQPRWPCPDNQLSLTFDRSLSTENSWLQITESSSTPRDIQECSSYNDAAVDFDRIDFSQY